MTKFSKLLLLSLTLILLLSCRPTDQNNDLSFLNDLEKTRVTRVVDGDTIVIETGEKVRFILVNTPESVHPDASLNSEFGKLASDYTYNHLHDQTIYLEKDVSDTDRYGRLLRYIYLSDGSFFNEQLVKEGYAQLATFPPDVKYLDTIQAAETYARENKLGLWAYEDSDETLVDASEGKYVASVKSDKIHLLDCRHVSSISDNNKIYFKSLEQAYKKDYIPCKACSPNLN